MKSHRVEYKKDSPRSKEGLPTEENYSRLVVAIAEQALWDYRLACEWLSQNSRPIKTSDFAMTQVHRFYSIREYFDSGCDGAIDTGNYSMAYQVDARLIKEGIDVDQARCNANKILIGLGQSYVYEWYIKKAKRGKKEDTLYDIC